MNTKPVVTITNFASNGGDHMCGDAEFSDGSKYRFVISGGTVNHLYLFEGGEYKWNDFARRAKVKAQMVLDHALPFLPLALEQLKERRIKEDAAIVAAQEADRKREALHDAAPDLLAACKEIAAWQESLGHWTMPKGDKQRLLAAIAKAS